MNKIVFPFILLFLSSVCSSFAVEWVDKDTGHRVVRLSNVPGSETLYFNSNSFIPHSQKMVFSSPEGISVIDLTTFQIRKIIKGDLYVIGVGRKNGLVYYLTRNHRVFAIDPTTRKSHFIFQISPGMMPETINANETWIAGTVSDAMPVDVFEEGVNRRSEYVLEDTNRKSKGKMMRDRLANQSPMRIFFYNIQTGEMKMSPRINAWLNHTQFSPTDPKLLLFCHEGPWEKVDRIWMMSIDDYKPIKIHSRSKEGEIAGHEFWGPDGKTVWYDLQTPRGKDFWLAGYNVETKKQFRYHLNKNQWSVHFNISPDGAMFGGDGGDKDMVAHSKDGKWIYLFYPQLQSDQSTDAVKTGVLRSEKLVNMQLNNYALEPNAFFSPDQKWIIFRSNMEGANHVYAVELKQTQKD